MKSVVPYTNEGLQPDEICLGCGQEVRECGCPDVPHADAHEIGEDSLLDTGAFPFDDFDDELDGPDDQEAPQ